jgi:CRP/FNR family transcriptional regulator, cyclic AMP receptor protein
MNGGILFDLSTLICKIGSVQHFRNLTVNDLRIIVSSGQLLRFSTGQTIFTEGQTCSGLFVLFTGKVHLCRTGPQGQPSIMGVIKPVIMFNEVSILDGGVNPVTALAVKDCVTWQISHDRFHPLMERYPPLGLSLLKVLANRNRMLLAQCEDIAFRSVLARTAKILLEISQNGRRTISRREHSNLELAAKAATVAEPISRSLQTLRQSGIICCDRGQITICQPERLAEIAEVYFEFNNN